MPSRLPNALLTFQRLLNLTFANMLIEFVKVYLDDILVYSESQQENVLHLRQVIEKIKKFTLYCKLKKCKFGKDYIEYLGHKTRHGLLRWTPWPVAISI